MFNIGWGEVFVVILVGLIVVGPERLPGVIQDVRAAVFAARKAIANAKQELNGEFDGLDEFRKPMSLSLIHISEPTRRTERSRMPSSA